MPFRQSLKFRRVTLDEGRFNRSLDEQMVDLIEAAAGEMLREMLKVIPVDTGMAQASLVPLRRIIREYAEIPDKPILRRERRNQGDGYPGGIKSFSAGIGMGNATAPKKRAGQNPSYSFSFRTNVPHFRTEWGSFEIARHVFRTYVDQHHRTAVPRLRDFLVVEAFKEIV